MKRLFAPGCALMLYKPHLAVRLHHILEENLEAMDRLLTCCRNQPPLEPGTEVINVCPGCDRRYRQNYQDSSTISLWEILARTDFFRFPDYRGKTMTIIDACPTRDQTRVHDAVRALLNRMNISLKEPRATRTHGICCGDSAWGEIPLDRVKQLMIKRSSEMPVKDVVVYCVSCAKSVFIGGKTPHYMVDLLFGEQTIPKTLEPDLWHKELDDFIRDH
jgi:Fe-S oxidoreductase